MTERPWAHWWQRKCPAVAWNNRDSFPRCELRFDHAGPHVAERGMYDEVWHETFLEQ